MCQAKNLKQFVDGVLSSIVDISMDIHGTRAIQTLVEVLGKDPTTFHNELLAIGKELEQYIFELSTHPNGNHVLQAYLIAFKASEMPNDPDTEGAEKLAIYTQFIFNASMSYCD